MCHYTACLLLVSPETPVQQGSEGMLRLALGFALLSTQPLALVDGSLKHE
jgi:hypothetical protein